MTKRSKSSKSLKGPKDRNYVQKHLRDFNKSAVHVDRKKADKAGQTKYEANYEEYE